MRLKRIALLVVAMLLVVGSAAAIAAAGAEDRRSDEGWEMGARYWWEDGLECLPPYQRKQVRDIMVLILDAYFGIDISRMSLEELDEVGSLIGNVGQEKVRSLFEHYAHKKGFEMPEPPEPSAPLPIEPVYWWEVASPQEEIEKMIGRIAEAKGMSRDEVKERFDELFPGVDVWRMTFGEFSHFLNNLPRPSLRLLSLAEVKQNPYVIAVYGRIPPLSTESELKEFDEKLRRVVSALPSFRNLINCPVIVIWSGQGAIRIAVSGDHVAAADEIYDIISRKAESLFGIEDVAIVFSGGARFIPMVGTSSAVEKSLQPGDAPVPDVEPTWAPPPYGARYRPIVGGIAKTSRDPTDFSTTSFAVLQFIWWRLWDRWDEDYVVTGHLGWTETGSRVPVNTRIYQPTIAPGNEAGRVIDNVGRTAYADVARVGIADADVTPYIHIGGGVLRPVAVAGHAPVGQTVWASGARTGHSFSGTIVAYGNIEFTGYIYDVLRNQAIVAGMILGPRDSGAPVYTGWPVGRVKIYGIAMGMLTVNDVKYAVFSPTSGIQHELGVEVWVQ